MSTLLEIVGPEADGGARADIVTQIELLNKFGAEKNYGEVLKCRIRIILAFDRIHSSTRSLPYKGHLNHAKNLLDDESWNYFARLYGPLASGRFVEASVVANQILHRCKSVSRYLHQLDEANRMLSELSKKLNSLGAWGLLQLEPGSSRQDVDRSYRELSAMLAGNGDEETKNLPEDVVDFNKALLNRVREAYRRLLVSVERRPLSEQSQPRADYYLSSEEAETKLQEYVATYLYLGTDGEVAEIKLQIVDILRKWTQIEPNLLNGHIKKINFLLEAGLNFEALVKAKFYQCSLWRELDPNKIDFFVASIEDKLNKLGPCGWLQLKPAASKKEAEESYNKLKAMFSKEGANLELHFMPIDEKLFQFSRKNLNNDLAYAYRSIRGPKLNLLKWVHKNRIW